MQHEANRAFHVQIGGSLAKLVYFSCEPVEGSIGGRLNFVKFETERIDACIDFVRRLQEDHRQLNGSAPEELCVMATGGGAFKYYDKTKKALGVEVIREDEMECLIIGTGASHHLGLGGIGLTNSLNRSRLLHN